MEPSRISSELVDFARGDERVKKAKKQLEEFTRRFPFRVNQKAIQNLTPRDIWEKGSKDSFFYWVQFGTYDVAHITVWSVGPFENARNGIHDFKKLLATIVDDSVSLHDKIDDPNWDKLGGFGGDRHICKKIVALFYPEKVLPIFNTKHLEYFASKIGIDPFHRMKELFQKDYDDEKVTVGEQFEVLNDVLGRWRQDNAPATDSLVFTRYLYKTFPPPKPTPVSEQFGLLSFAGLLFEPENEMGVVSLFSMYHRELDFPFIVKIQKGFPDATVIDTEGNTVTIEFEYIASNFIQHGHPQKGCDLIVCWENDLSQNQPLGPSILVLKDKMRSLIKGRFLEEE